MAWCLVGHTENCAKFIFRHFLLGGPGQLSQYSDLLPAWRSGDQIQMRTRCFSNIQTGPGAQTASYTVSTELFTEVKRSRRGVNHPPNLAPRLKKKLSDSSTPLLGLHRLFWGEIYLLPLSLRSFLGDKVAGLWNWPHNHIQHRDEEWVEL